MALLRGGCESATFILAGWPSLRLRDAAACINMGAGSRNFAVLDWGE